VQISVLYFASARERAGTSRELYEWPEGTNVGAALQLIVARHPSLAGLVPHLRVSINQQFATEEEAVPNGAELALIPPVAGGGGLFILMDGPLSLEQVVAAVQGEAYGGLVTFTGTVRNDTEGRRVVRLEYEAYVPMARQMFARIGDEVRERWPGARVAIAHRVGSLSPGDLAVVIAAAAAHRKEAFRACEYAIDRIKEEAPIWKREIYQDGAVWVGQHP